MGLLKLSYLILFVVFNVFEMKSCLFSMQFKLVSAATRHFR